MSLGSRGFRFRVNALMAAGQSGSRRSSGSGAGTGGYSARRSAAASTPSGRGHRSSPASRARNRKLWTVPWLTRLARAIFAIDS
ncbi:MAG: hypothetical protein OXL68_15645 [Paracoccaceae bacterium]|nr:hypothetical protein [Paracoccaceae bacterium]